MVKDLKTVTQEWIGRVLHHDQVSENFIVDFDLPKILAKADVGYVQNQNPKQHCIDAFQSIITLSLARSEKTRFGSMYELNARDIYPLFGIVVIIDASPGAGLDVIYERCGFIVATQFKSCADWGNTSSRQKTKENAAEFLRHNYSKRECQIVIGSENGNGTPPSDYFFDGYPVFELYGHSCNLFFTGKEYPLHQIEKEVFAEVTKQRLIPIEQRNKILIKRRAQDLYTQLLKSKSEFRNIRLVDDDGCPIWSNWRQAIKEPLVKKHDKYIHHQISLNI